jgi:hypothetical protein
MQPLDCADEQFDLILSQFHRAPKYTSSPHVDGFTAVTQHRGLVRLTSPRRQRLAHDDERTVLLSGDEARCLIQMLGPWIVRPNAKHQPGDPGYSASLMLKQRHQLSAKALATRVSANEQV